jgi:thiol-disulfide isomerase/thioredoxin
MNKVLPSQTSNTHPVAAGEIRAQLMVGDKAPRLQTGKWIQGEPVAAFASNHIYIVELWATWCGPCVQSIPHLNQLWQRFQDKGVIIVGQDVSDSDEAVAPFVKKMGDRMTYRVALDDKSQYAGGWMAEHWWKRKVNIHGIPMAFVINRDGFIAWIGHPMALKEQVLADIVAGNYDMACAAVEYRKELQLDKKFQELKQKLYSAIENKKWTEAEFAMDQIDNLLPKFKKSFTEQRLKILLGKKEFDDAYQFADTFSEAHAKDDVWQNKLAWTIVTAGTVNDRCIGLAESMAERAVQLSKGKENEAGALDTLARAQFMRGKKQEAVSTGEKALNIVSDLEEKGRLESRLASYQAGVLPNAK